MKHPQVVWSIFVIFILALLGVPAGYQVVTGNHIRFLQNPKVWASPVLHVEVTAQHPDGSQDWIKRWGPIVIASRNVHVSSGGRWELTGSKFTILSPKGTHTLHATTVSAKW